MASFRPSGNTITFTAAVAAPSPVQCLSENAGQANQYLVSNIGTGWVFIAAEPTSALSTANAVIPTGTATKSIPIAPSSQQTFTLPANAYFTGICAAATNIVYITPGSGE